MAETLIEVGEEAYEVELRDRFAIAAMNAIIIGNRADISCTGRVGAKGMAKDAYIIADAMLEARKATAEAVRG